MWIAKCCSKKLEKLLVLFNNSAVKEFEDLCFDFGIELEEVVEPLMQTTEKELAGKNNSQSDSDNEIYRIDIPANRYDMLCVEGIARAIKVYLELERPPVYTVKEKVLQVVVKPEVLGLIQTGAIRPIVVAAVLRNVTFDAKSYQSFIDLQDKLHNNICRYYL